MNASSYAYNHLFIAHKILLYLQSGLHSHAGVHSDLVELLVEAHTAQVSGVDQHLNHAIRGGYWEEGGHLQSWGREGGGEGGRGGGRGGGGEGGREGEREGGREGEIKEVYFL